MKVNDDEEEEDDDDDEEEEDEEGEIRRIWRNIKNDRCWWFTVKLNISPRFNSSILLKMPNGYN